MFNLNYLYEFRKKLHRIPEIAFNEFQTQELIKNQLNTYKQLKLTEFQPTGLLYEYSQGTGDYLLFRADMDALPIQEKTECNFMSQNNGFAHACGHDIHMTILIGLIHYVIKNNLKINILFLFQPAEEGSGGAEHILNTGIFNNYNIEAAFALHVSGEYTLGQIGLKSGIIFGIPQEFNIEFFGKSGHVATPHKGNDALIAAMAFYSEMNTLLNKRFPAQDAVIFHIGKANAGTVRNVIPDYCKLEGTSRCLTKTNKEKINQLMLKVAEGIKQSYEIDVKVSLLSSYDPVVNNEKLVNLTHSLLSDTSIEIINVDSSMTGEDFGFFTTLYPGMLFWLGTHNPKTNKNKEDLHSSKFLPDEKSIETALQLYKKILDYKLKHSYLLN
jgi:N-acetyldiaminopimelate deacetylase